MQAMNLILLSIVSDLSEHVHCACRPINQDHVYRVPAWPNNNE